MEEEIKIIECLASMREWQAHRKWLKENNIDFASFPEEVEFRENVEKYKLLTLAKNAKILGAIKFAAAQKTHEKIEQMRI